MIYVVMIILWVAMLLYILMGGADFGVGILEFFAEKKHKARTSKVMYEAIGPIWEANHMWLIMVVVILFVGFPVIYSVVSTYLHVPIVMMLLGIMARGTAFTFRHYDAIHDKLQDLYTKIFVYASLMTPLFLGIIAGSIVSGRIDRNATDFLDAYIFSWLGVFPVLVGCYAIAIFGFLAAVFIIGETTTEEERNYAIRKAKQMSLAAIVLAMLIMGCAYLEDIPVANWLFGNYVSTQCTILCIVLLCWMWKFMFKKGNAGRLRIVAAAQIGLLFIAVTYSHYPILVHFKDGTGLSLADGQAGELSIRYLGMALLFGSIFILPALSYLLYSFQKRKKIWS